MKKSLGALLTFFAISISAFGADIKFAQIDGLMYAPNNASEERFDKIITEINKQKNISFVVFSGNNIAGAKKENLTAFIKEAKKLHKPYYIILGNKDVNKNKELGKDDYLKLVNKKIKSPNYVFEKQGVVFIVVDGSKEVIPTPQGYYKPETIQWLDEQLTLYNDRNVIILQHFPIIPPAQKESLYTSKPENILKVVAKHKNIKAVISGHFGVNNEQDIEGIKFISTAQAPVYRIIDIMDCDSANPEIWSIIKE